VKPAVSQAVAAFAVAAVGAGCTLAAVAGSGNTVAVVVGGCAVLALAAFIGFDSARRGRSGPGWLGFTLLLAPIALPVFAFLAISDRSKGRAGIEAGWPPVARWCTLGAIALAVAASYLALAGLTVASFSSPSASVSGHCDNALSIALGDRSGLPSGIGNSFTTPGEIPSSDDAFTQAANSIAAQCAAKASRRMAAAAISLAGAFGLGLIGTAAGRTVKPVAYGTRRRHPSVRRGN
jgi:hypothetical protein